MILLNTDFILAYFEPRHQYHTRAIKVIRSNTDSDFVISNLIKQELASVTCLKYGNTEARKTIKSIELFDPKDIFIRVDDTKRIWDMFLKQNTKMSFVDTSNIYLSKKFNYKIASFDRVYPNNLKVE
jgi:predicted nucleic acid-binding protein